MFRPRRAYRLVRTTKEILKFRAKWVCLQSLAGFPEVSTPTLVMEKGPGVTGELCKKSSRIACDRS